MLLDARVDGLLRWGAHRPGDGREREHDGRAGERQVRAAANQGRADQAARAGFDRFPVRAGHREPELRDRAPGILEWRGVDAALVELQDRHDGLAHLVEARRVRAACREQLARAIELAPDLAVGIVDLADRAPAVLRTRELLGRLQAVDDQAVGDLDRTDRAVVLVEEGRVVAVHLDQDSRKSPCGESTNDSPAPTNRRSRHHA